MTDQEFEQLKQDIREAFAELEWLQAIYVRETGRRMQKEDSSWEK